LERASKQRRANELGLAFCLQLDWQLGPELEVESASVSEQQLELE
jgi:hypothetical protein